MRKKRVVGVSVLPGQPLDGSGRVCIHLFVQDDTGLFVEPHVLHPVVENGQVVKQKVEARPTRGRLACDRRRMVAPKMTPGGVTVITHRTDDPRAVTCPKCMETIEYAAAMSKLEEQPQAVEGGS